MEDRKTMKRRILKINELIKREISQIVLKEIEFPKGTLVTLTRVETSPNLDNCKVYVSVIPETKEKEIFKILESKIGFIQRKLNKKLKMSKVPKINWEKETKTKEAERIERILVQLQKGKKLNKIEK